MKLAVFRTGIDRLDRAAAATADVYGWTGPETSAARTPSLFPRSFGGGASSSGATRGPKLRERGLFVPRRAAPSSRRRRRAARSGPRPFRAVEPALESRGGRSVKQTSWISKRSTLRSADQPAVCDASLQTSTPGFRARAAMKRRACSPSRKRSSPALSHWLRFAVSREGRKAPRTGHSSEWSGGAVRHPASGNSPGSPRRQP